MHKSLFRDFRTASDKSCAWRPGNEASFVVRLLITLALHCFPVPGKFTNQHTQSTTE